MKIKRKLYKYLKIIDLFSTSFRWRIVAAGLAEPSELGFMDLIFAIQVEIHCRVSGKDWLME